MGESFQKATFAIMALSMTVIAAELLPISKQSASWNRCLQTTGSFLSNLHDLEGRGGAGREAIAVNICNGAVHYSNK